MRWLYHNKTRPAEVAEHNRLLRKIDAWWDEFERNEERLEDLFRQVADWDLPDWMNRHLRSIHPELMWEFGPAINVRGHRLVITPETRSELRPLVETIVARAPKLKTWEFHSYRIAEDVDTALPTIETRTGLDISDVTVALNVGQDNRIDLTFRWEQIPGNDDQAFDSVFVAAESLLGEELLDRWVGVINLVDHQTPPEQGQRFLSLERLKPTFDALVSSTRAQLPAEPYSAFADDGQWAGLKLEPEEARDYPERFDLLTSITCNPELIAATFSNGPFYSERYSRCGETFCYLKVDNSVDTANDYQDRDDMEEAVRNALASQDLGGLIGGGTGLRYSYIELALTDVERGIAAICRTMREGNVPRRSWIQFHDAHLAAEWVGVYDDSPAPPMEKVEL